MGRGRRRRLRREAIAEYANCPAYWYIPKARALNDANVGFCARTLQLLFEEFLGARCRARSNATGVVLHTNRCMASVLPPSAVRVVAGQYDASGHLWEAELALDAASE